METDEQYRKRLHNVHLCTDTHSRYDIDLAKGRELDNMGGKRLPRLLNKESKIDLVYTANELHNIASEASGKKKLDCLEAMRQNLFGVLNNAAKEGHFAYTYPLGSKQFVLVSKEDVVATCKEAGLVCKITHGYVEEMPRKDLVEFYISWSNPNNHNNEKKVNT